MNEPRVSIVILTHNRKAILQQSLSSALRLDWPGLEIIVVDNHSTDGTAEMVEKEFGSRVRIIPRHVDSPTAGRNEGFRAATGEYVLSLDNDMVFPDAGVIAEAAALFESHPNVALITFRIAGAEDPNIPLREHWWHPVSFEEGKDRFFYTDYFSEGALFLRASVVHSMGGYDEDYFACFEGVDMGLRILRAGYDILYAPTIACVELQVRRGIRRTRSEWNYFFLRNKIWTAWKNYPLLRSIPFVGPRILKDAVYSMRYGWIRDWIRAVVHGIAAPQAIRNKRDPLPRSAWKRIEAIRKGSYLPRRLGTGVLSA